jgi:hypothetical protein
VAAAGVPLAQAPVRPDPADLELAAYLLARQASGREVPASTRELLVRANESRKEVLRLMDLGRANVAQDLDATRRRGFHGLLAQRRVSGEFSSLGQAPAEIQARDAALSARVRSGNCGEFAKVAAHVHAARLQTGERLEIQASRERDHSWVMVQGPPSPGGSVPRAILDPWTDGPAVDPADHRFTVGAATSPRTLHGIDDTEAPHAHARFEAMRHDPGARAARQLELLTTAARNADRKPPDRIWQATPVLAPEFCATAQRAIESRRDDPSLRAWATALVGELASASPGQAEAAADAVIDMATRLDVVRARSLAQPAGKRPRPESPSSDT